MNIVVLDGYAVNPGDLNWDQLHALGNLKIHDRTPQDKIIERATNADILITNKCILNESIFDELPKLKYIGLFATGYNNIDINAAKERNIVVCNSAEYSTPSVAQHVFALILELTNNVGLHNQSVHNNEWAVAKDWCYLQKPIIELAGKTLGIYGLGNIGSAVAHIALALGMNVIATRKSNKAPENALVQLVTENELLSNSDILTLHAPLSDDNFEFIHKASLQKMKNSAFLINTGRGGLINEADLRDALSNNTIAAAALDVLQIEPPVLNHILVGLPNCIITPHQAWASHESRARLLNIVADNISAFINGKPNFNLAT